MCHFSAHIYRISRNFQKCVTFRHVTFWHDSVNVLSELHEELQMLESHFVAQKSGNEKGEPGKSPQEEKIKALDRQLNIELKVKAGAENMIETCQRN